MENENESIWKGLLILWGKGRRRNDSKRLGIIIVLKELFYEIDVVKLGIIFYFLINWYLGYRYRNFMGRGIYYNNWCIVLF